MDEERVIRDFLALCWPSLSPDHMYNVEQAVAELCAVRKNLLHLRMAEVREVPKFNPIFLPEGARESREKSEASFEKNKQRYEGED